MVSDMTARRYRRQSPTPRVWRGPDRFEASFPNQSGRCCRALRAAMDLGEGLEREAVRSELLCRRLPMAHRIASRFRDRGEDVDELRQVAVLGLVKSIDPAPIRVPSESCAIPTVSGGVKRHSRDRTWAVRVPRRIEELRHQARVACCKLTEHPDTAPVGIAARTASRRKK